MNDVERQKLDEISIETWRTYFADMSDDERNSFFIFMDESAILSFEVNKDETIAQAKERHNIKLRAIAAALDSLPSASKDQHIIKDLRRLAGAEC